jgi:predicted ABC-type ATPase
VGSESLRPTNEVEKHGTHDQSSHGNWAGTRQVAGSITEKQAGEFKGGSAEAHLVSDGKGGLRFSDERQALHNAIVEEALRGIPVSANPTYYMMGGGPTAGKSSMIERDDVSVPNSSKAVQVNPDDIKLKLPEYNQKSTEERAPYTHEESSHIAKRIQNEAMAKGLDVVLDGTGDSSVTKANAKIDKAREAGYKVVGFYATIPMSEALRRNEERAIKTGRKVPPAVVREIHSSVSRVFPELAPKFDSVKLFDTTTRDVKLIAEGTRGSQLSVLDQRLYAEFLAKGGE